VTKYRKKIFNAGVYAFFKKRVMEVKKHYPQIDILEQNHDRDHIHLLLSIPPKMSVGSVVRLIKSNTARDLKKNYPFLKKCYFGTESVWSDGYFVSTVGVNEAVIKRYIEYQGRLDTGQAKLELK
jgi:putative transposase